MQLLRHTHKTPQLPELHIQPLIARLRAAPHSGTWLAHDPDRGTGHHRRRPGSARAMARPAESKESGRSNGRRARAAGSISRRRGRLSSRTMGLSMLASGGSAERQDRSTAMRRSAVVLKRLVHNLMLKQLVRNVNGRSAWDGRRVMTARPYW